MASDRTVADVYAAIEALDRGAWWRLRHEAREALGKAGVDDPACDHEDLLQEALVRLLSAARRWRRDRGFEAQVKSTMGSIASDWARRGTSNPVTCEASLPWPDEEDEDATSLVENAPSPERGEDQRLVAAGVLEQVVKLFADDPDALGVIGCLSVGLNRREMCRRTGLSAKAVGTVLRRIRRGAAKLRFGLVW